MLIIAVLCLCGGAIVNTLLAWACAAWSEQETWVSYDPIEPPTKWPTYLEALGWPSPADAQKLRGIGTHVGNSTGVSIIEITGGDLDARYDHPATSPKVFVSLEIRQFGVPARSLQWETHGVVAGPQGMNMVNAAHNAAGWRTGIDLRKPFLVRRLPLIPIWPGFAINTALYAVVVLFFCLACRLVWRLIRIKRGRCPACGYPRGSSEVCSECGRALKTR